MSFPVSPFWGSLNLMRRDALSHDNHNGTLLFTHPVDQQLILLCLKLTWECFLVWFWGQNFTVNLKSLSYTHHNAYRWFCSCFILLCMNPESVKVQSLHLHKCCSLSDQLPAKKILLLRNNPCWRWNVKPVQCLHRANKMHCSPYHANSIHCQT